MKRSRVLIVLLSIIAPVVLAQQYPIAELRATGSQFYEEADILSYSGLTVNNDRAVSLEAVKDAAAKIANSGVFKTVSYQHTKMPGGMKVVFLVADNDEDQFIPANFENIVWYSPEELAAQVHQRVPLFRTHVSLSGTITKEVTDAIADILAQRGVKAHVSAEPFTRNSGTPDEMRFVIDDRNIVIGRAEVTGAAPEFASQMQTILKKLEGKPYVRSTVRDFSDRELRKLYYAKGYIKAQFGDPKHSVIADETGDTKVLVSIPVIEGRIYKLTGATWSGNRLMRPAELERYVHFFPGLAMNGDLLDFEIRKLREAYAQRGYMHMTLEAKPTFDDAAGTVAYQMIINEGDQFRMGEIEVAGLSKPEAEKLLSAWKIRPGDPFDSVYAARFAASVMLDDGAAYSIEQSEGEQPQTVDITFVRCPNKEACHSNQSVLYTPEEKKTTRR
jgi:outer membrane protein assembly factor BamA